MFKLTSKKLNLVAGGCYCYCFKRPIDHCDPELEKRFDHLKDKAACYEHCLKPESIQWGYYGFSRCTETIQDYEPMVYSEEYYAFQELMKQVDAMPRLTVESLFPS